MSYYDIDAILIDAQKVPCTFTLTVPHLGHLDNSPSTPLKAGTHLPLPLWLAERLAVSSPSSTQNLITLDLPPSLQPRVLNALKADAKSVDIRAQAPHFYGLGVRILDLFEEEEVLDILAETFRNRAVEVGDHAVNKGSRGGAGVGGGGGVGGADGVEFLRGLDEWERSLFRVAHDSARGMGRWMADVKKS